jgi:dihydrofolate reductase
LSKQLRAVFASCLGGGFGLNPNLLPWPHNKEDMKFFKEITSQDNGVIFAGRNTAAGLPRLDGRKLYVISNMTLREMYQDLSMKNRPLGVFTYRCFLNVASSGLYGTIIGGATLLTPEILDQCKEVYHTVFKQVYPSDVKLSPETLEWLGRNLGKSEIIKENDTFLIRRYNLV